MADKKKTKKSSWQTVEEYQAEKLKDISGAAISESELDRLNKISKDRKESYTSRNEFKPGFYDQKDKPPITAETMYGKGTTRTLEYPTVDPDTSMMMNRKKGGMTKGQKKVSKVMKEFKAGKLHSGKKGPVVKNPKQAIAIALSEAGMSKPKEMSGGGEVSEYVSDLIGPTTVTPRVEGGTRQESGAIIQDKGVGINIGGKFGNIDISKKEEKIKFAGGEQKIDSTTGAYRKKFESGFGIEGSITKRSLEGGRKQTDKRATISYEKTFRKGGAVEIGKGRDYIKDLL